MFVSVTMRLCGTPAPADSVGDNSTRQNKRPRCRPSFSRSPSAGVYANPGLASRGHSARQCPADALADLRGMLEEGLHEQFVSSVRQQAKSLGTRGINRLMDAAAKLQHQPFGTAEFLLKELFTLLDPPDSASFSILIAMHGRHGNHEAARAVFESIDDPNEICISSMLSVYGRAGLVDEAWGIFKATPAKRLRTPPVLNAMLGVLVRHGYLTPAFALYDSNYSSSRELDQAPPDNYTISTILKACAKTRDLERAILVVERAQELDLSLNAVTFNTLLDVCTKSRTPERVGEFYRLQPVDSTLEVMDSTNCAPKEASHTQKDELRHLNSMINGYGRAGMPDKAMGVFEELCARGLSPDAVTFNTLLRAAAKEADFRMATRVLDTMTRTYGHSPDEFTFHTLLFSCSKRGKDDMTFELYNKMRDSGVKPTAMTYTALLEVCGKRKQLLRAWDVMGLMRSEDVSPDTHIMNAMIHVCSRCKDVEGAFSVFRDMEEKGISADDITYNTLINCVGRLGHTTKAWALMREMESRGIEPSATAYNSIATSYAYHGDVQSILDLFILCKADPALNLPDRYSYGSLLEASIRSRDLHRALAFREEMKQLGFSAGAGLECWLVERLLEAGESTQALKIVDGMDEKKLRTAFSGTRKKVWLAVQAAQRRNERKEPSHTDANLRPLKATVHKQP